MQEHSGQCNRHNRIELHFFFFLPFFPPQDEETFYKESLVSVENRASPSKMLGDFRANCKP